MKKIISKLLVFVMVVALLVPSVMTVAKADTMKGDGTKANPYIITSEADFKTLDQSSKYIYAQLGGNITLSKDGYTMKTFKGELDGKGFTIKNSKSGGSLIKYFYGGKLHNFTWNLDKFSYMVEETLIGSKYVYEGITVKGDVTVTSNNNNEGPLVVYAGGDITFKGVNIDMNFQSPTYNGLFIGYEPARNSNYVFENCKVKGSYVASDMGILFGNGSIGAKDYGFHHILGVSGVSATSTVKVTGMDLTEANVIGLKTVPHMLCGVSYNKDIMDALETEIVKGTTGISNMKKAASLEGCDFTLNKDGNLKFEIKDSKTEIGSILVSSEVYSNVFTNGIANGTQKHSVTEKIKVVDGVNTYYSSIGKIKFYDGVNGTKGTTGLNGQHETITVDGNTYYTLSYNRDGDFYTFRNDVAEHSNTARDAQLINVYVCDKNNKLVNVVNGPKTIDFSIPKISSKEVVTESKLSSIALEDGWTWVTPDTSVVYGGQVAFAKKANEIAPVKITGLPIEVSKIELDKSEINLEKGKNVALKAIVSPTNATDKSVIWTSEDEKIAKVDNNGNITAVNTGNTKITAKAGTKTATCKVTVYEVKAETPSVPTTSVKDVVAGMTTESAAKAESVLNTMIDKSIAGEKVTGMDDATAKAIAKAVENGKIITTEVYADTLTEAPKDAEAVRNAAQKLANKYDIDLTIEKYIDLGVNVKVENKVVGELTELDSPVEFTIAIPEDVQKVAKSYFIIRNHETANGVETSVIVPKINEDGTLTFKTDKFSTYALAYSETEIKDLTDSNGDSWIDSNDIVGETTDGDINNGNSDSNDNNEEVDKENVVNDKTDDKVQTGDNTAITLLAIIAVLSGAGIVLLRRKSTEK